jgi:peptidoglycan/xylan/chitin deacetylase (PgdA/CDA1 family)
LPEKPVVITIDDGYLSGFEIAYPILEKYNMKATMFIIGVSVGKDIYKETDIPIIPRFSYSQAREMADSGLISIQSHSHDMHQHQPFEILPARRGVLPFEWESEKTYMENFRADYMRSKTEIETHVGTSPVAFAYPFGAHNDLTETMLKEMGVKATLTTKNGVNKVAKGQPESLFALKRIAVSNEMTPDEVISLIEGSNSYPPVETDSAPPVGFHSPPPVTPTPPAVPEPHVAFELTFPETGAINVTGRNITINVTNDNKLAVIKAPLSDGQKLSASRTGVYINVDEMDPEKPVYITVDTRNLTNGGRIEFPASISQSGKSDIVYTIRINNNLAQ